MPVKCAVATGRAWTAPRKFLVKDLKAQYFVKVKATPIGEIASAAMSADLKPKQLSNTISYAVNVWLCNPLTALI